MGTIDPEVQVLAARLRETCGALAEGESVGSIGFWAHRPNENFPPPTTESPDEYHGGDRISIACTQTGLPARQQREQVLRWCAELPSFRELRYVWFHSKTSQDLFEAACKLPRLEGLYIKWSSVQDLQPLTEAKTLQNFHLGSSPGVRSIKPLAGLRQLLGLELENLKDIRSLEPLASLTGLVSLGFTGAEYKRNTVESFGPVGNLRNLKWLHLGALRTDDMSLRPLGNLKALEYLTIGNFFSVREFAWLSVHLPHASCDWLQPYARFHKSLLPCHNCRKNWKVVTSGKGGRLLCPTCDAEKLAKHVLHYEAMKSAAQIDES